MKSDSKAGATQERTVVLDDPEDRTGRLRAVGGSASDAWNSVIANSTLQTLWVKNADQKMTDKQISAALAGLAGIEPKDELEGMFAAQLLACHFASMECFRRAMNPEQTFGGRRENLNQANKLSRTYSTLVESLNKHRGKGQQTVKVEHVHVHEGGQAIVGNVSPGGGTPSKIEDQSHEPQALPVSDGTALQRAFQENEAKVPQSRHEG